MLKLYDKVLIKRSGQNIQICGVPQCES